MVVAFVASVVALSSLGCASGGRSGGGRDAAFVVDGGPRLDAPPAVLDAPLPDAARPDVGERPDAPPPPGTDAGPTLVRDSGVDAPIPPGTDAGPPPECVAASDCSDLDPCNGVERCELGMCRPGVALTCDDGIPCTTDSCVAGACNYVPNDAVCGTGMRCTSTGCMSTSTCSDSPCRLVSPQCGCGAGQACYVAGASRACAAAGTATEGSTCTNTNDCTAGNVCLDFSAAAGGTMCSHFCNVDSDCAGGGLCIGQIGDGAGGAVPGAVVCTRSCDPVNQTGCAAGLECTLFREAAGAMRLYRDCGESLGAGTWYAPCTTEDECAAGFACQDVGFGPECTEWCRVGSLDCTFGDCLGFTTPLLVGGIEYGVCSG